MIIYAATNGYLDSVPVELVREYEIELYRHVETRHPQVLSTLADKKAIDDELKGQLNGALKEFGEQFAAARKTAA
jgi:F-type H+-transporting ATPase subunit alpha